MTVKSVPTYNWYTLVEVGIISDWQYFWKMSVVKIRQIGEYEISYSFQNPLVNIVYEGASVGASGDEGCLYGWQIGCIDGCLDGKLDGWDDGCLDG